MSSRHSYSSRTNTVKDIEKQVLNFKTFISIQAGILWKWVDVHTSMSVYVTAIYTNLTLLCVINIVTPVIHNNVTVL